MKLMIVGLLLMFLSACQQNTTGSTDTPIKNDAVACTKDLKMCPDGQGVGRDPTNNCEFHACKKPIDTKQEPLLCTQDVKQCGDGSYVGRDSNNNCAFKPCPEGSNLQ